MFNLNFNFLIMEDFMSDIKNFKQARLMLSNAGVIEDDIAMVVKDKKTGISWVSAYELYKSLKSPYSFIEWILKSSRNIDLDGAYRIVDIVLESVPMKDMEITFDVAKKFCRNGTNRGKAILKFYEFLEHRWIHDEEYIANAQQVHDLKSRIRALEAENRVLRATITSVASDLKKSLQDNS